MSAPLTEKEFSKHVNTKFRVKGEQPMELELTEVKAYMAQANEESDMERFSAFFHGPADRYLPQATYALEHEAWVLLICFWFRLRRVRRVFGMRQCSITSSRRQLIRSLFFWTPFHVLVSTEIFDNCKAQPLVKSMSIAV